MNEAPTVAALVETDGRPRDRSPRPNSAAAAIASALTSGRVGRRALPSHLKVGLIASVAGLLLVVFGLLSVPLAVLPIVAGGASIAWAVRTVREARA